ASGNAAGWRRHGTQERGAGAGGLDSRLRRPAAAHQDNYGRERRDLHGSKRGKLEGRRPRHHRGPEQCGQRAAQSGSHGPRAGILRRAMPAVIEVKDLVKDYRLGEVPVHVLKGISFEIERGSFVAIMGPSGSGKSTLMNILGCLDRPTSGTYILDGVSVGELNRDELAEIRSEKVGFVFQQFNLLARTSAVENVELPLMYTNAPAHERRERALRALKAVGLEGLEEHQPSQLSGGQQQRVAIARSLVNNPKIILADEPTGALDSRTSIEIMAIFQRLNRESGITMIVVTHDPDVAAYSNRSIHFKDGRLQLDERLAQPREARHDLEQLPAETPDEVAA